MPVALDIAGNFAAGQNATLRRRRARQQERAIDYELAREQEDMMGRRGSANYQRELRGADPFDFGDFQTNKDPMFQRLGQWWKERRASRVTPSRMPEAAQQQQGQADRAIAAGYTDEMGFRNGGRVEAGVGAPRRTAIASAEAVPQSYADGGYREPLGTTLREGVRSAGRALHPRRLLPRTMAELDETGADLGAEVRHMTAPGRSAQERGASARRVLTEGVEGVVEPVAGLASDVLAPLAPIAKGAAGFFGFDGSGGGDSAQAIPTGAPDTAAQPEAPEDVPVTPDEAVAQAAIQEGTQLAQQAAEANAPPGAIDFSQVDFRADEIPNMPVKDWIEYRSREVENLMLQGMTAREAHADITAMQQQGFVDYAQQALIHLDGGDPASASTAMRAAYQYFPNGSDIQMGVYQDPETGRPSLISRGFDEETGEAKGNPTILDSARLAAHIENFSNPEAFRVWTKDEREFEQSLREEDQAARESDAKIGLYGGQEEYYRASGRARELSALADLIPDPSDIAANEKVYRDAINEAGILEGIEGGDARGLASLASRIRAAIPDQRTLPDNEILELVMDSQARGDLESLKIEFGVR